MSSKIKYTPKIGDIIRAKQGCQDQRHTLCAYQITDILSVNFKPDGSDKRQAVFFIMRLKDDPNYVPKYAPEVLELEYFCKNMELDT